MPHKHSSSNIGQPVGNPRALVRQVKMVEEMDICRTNDSVNQLEYQLDAVKHVIEECRAAGKRCDYGEAIQQAEVALETLGEIEHRLRESSSIRHAASPDVEKLLYRNEIRTASVHGYMGYALMKQGHFETALTYLEKSINLRRVIEHEQDNAMEASVAISPDSIRQCNEALVTKKAYEHCQARVSQSKDGARLVKYPRTAHLFDTGGTATTADDLVLSENDAVVTALCNGDTCIVIEEKLDGANLGILFDPLTGQILVQNRSHFISSGEHAQFSRITEWIEQHRGALHHILCTDDYVQRGQRILHGEWLAARHSVPYHRLPGFFVAYDIFVKNEDKFFSRKRFHTVMKESGIPVAPVLESRIFGPYTSREARAGRFRSELFAFLDSKSAFRNDEGTVEGIVLRVDDPESLWNQHRYKIVRPDFVRGCNDGHWQSRTIEKQQVDFAFGFDYVTECYAFADTDDNSTIIEEDTKMPAEARLSESQSIKSAGKVSKEEREYAAQRARARRRVPRCVMLMGLPGSGKSTFANRLAASAPSEWTVVNQDCLGKKKCIALAGMVSKKNRVILDRCNATVVERQEWHGIVGSQPKGDTALVYFAANVDTCIERVKNRAAHETIPEGTGERIVKCVAKTLEAPSSQDESLFGTLEIVNTFQESNALLYRWGVDDGNVHKM